MDKLKKKKEIFNNCILFKNLNLIGKKWTIFILLKIFQNKEQKVNYSEFKNELNGITSKILSLRLNELIKYKILEKRKEKINNVVYTYYYLTESGNKLKPIINSFIRWNKKYNKCKMEKYCLLKINK